MTKDDPSLFDAISTMIAIGMIIGLLTGCSQADPRSGVFSEREGVLTG